MVDKKSPSLLFNVNKRIRAAQCCAALFLEGLISARFLKSVMIGPSARRTESRNRNAHDLPEDFDPDIVGTDAAIGTRDKFLEMP